MSLVKSLFTIILILFYVYSSFNPLVFISNGNFYRNFTNLSIYGCKKNHDLYHKNSKNYMKK